MITMLGLFIALLVLMLIAALVTGLLAVSPILVMVICLPLIDYFVIKLIIGDKKKKKNKK